MTQLPFTVTAKSDHIVGSFKAMASPCELLFDLPANLANIDLATLLMHQAFNETKRIENKFSRYLSNNLMHSINTSQGKPVPIDDETFQLLGFANTCYELSAGMFDISSGILRKAWRFDGSSNLPNAAQVDALLPYIGWQKVTFDAHSLSMPQGFELDFGGIGKEYAVNKVAQIITSGLPKVSVLINFGGDIQVTRPRINHPYWQIGIENPTESSGTAVVNIAHGGLATSGDASRFLVSQGKRYSHILNPHSGYPVANAPRSVTVASEHCIQAGLLATLSLLQGPQAEAFLDEQEVLYWCYR